MTTAVPMPVMCIPCGLALRTGSRLYHAVCWGATQPCECTHEALNEVLLRPRNEKETPE